MKPKTLIKDPQKRLFEIELARIVDDNHELIHLSKAIDWSRFEAQFGQNYSDHGAPAIRTRLMIALHYLKYLYNLSDEETVARWRENPYWQAFSGEEYFQHTAPIDPSSMTRWRKRHGEKSGEALLFETIQLAKRKGAIHEKEVSIVNIDTTVQEKSIAYPTDVRLYRKACD